MSTKAQLDSFDFTVPGELWGEEALFYRSLAEFKRVMRERLEQMLSQPAASNTLPAQLFSTSRCGIVTLRDNKLAAIVTAPSRSMTVEQRRIEEMRNYPSVEELQIRVGMYNRLAARYNQALESIALGRRRQDTVTARNAIYVFAHAER